MDQQTSERVVETLLDQIEELKAGQISAPMEAGSEIHGMTVSANAMGPILFALHGTLLPLATLSLACNAYRAFPFFSTWQQV
jgi:hypothetical protein